MHENAAEEKNKPLVYVIYIKDELSPVWAEWFEGFEICCQQGITTLTGPIRDQAALHGLLRKILELGLTLLSVNTIT